MSDYLIFGFVVTISSILLIDRVLIFDNYCVVFLLVIILFSFLIGWKRWDK